MTSRPFFQSDSTQVGQKKNYASDYLYVMLLKFTTNISPVSRVISPGEHHHQGASCWSVEAVCPSAGHLVCDAALVVV